MGVVGAMAFAAGLEMWRCGEGIKGLESKKGNRTY